MLQRIVVTLLFGLAALLASSALARAEAFTHKVRDSQEPIAVKPLDDPTNPYRGLYGEWDRWIYANAAPPDAYWVTGPDADGVNTGIDTYVDASGYMLPYLETQRLHFDFYATGQRTTEAFPHQLYAYGPLPAELAQRMRQARTELRAAYLPPVPQWLVELSPEWSIILPDGRVAARNLFVSAWEMDGSIAAIMSVPTRISYKEYKSPGWILYSASGEVLKSQPPGHPWYELTFPGFAEIYAAYAAQNEFTFAAHKYGYIRIYDGNRQDDAPGAQHGYGWFDYDGTPYPANSLMRDDLMVRRNGNAFLGIHSYDLPLVYAAQQAALAERGAAQQ